jgi:hypothetical protein
MQLISGGVIGIVHFMALSKTHLLPSFSWPQSKRQASERDLLIIPVFGVRRNSEPEKLAKAHRSTASDYVI